jgi:hypothetical protein
MSLKTRTIGNIYVLVPLLVLGCTSTIVAPNVPCPPRPELEAIEPQLQLQTPPEVLKIAASNQIKLKQHIKLLETYCESR